MKGKFYTRDLGEACEEYNKIFGANKNLYRIICSMQDGCKPVQRRFLYSLYKGKGRTQFIKMSKAAADTTAAFHPHGSVSVEEVGAKMANPTCNNIMTVEGQGNFGSYKADEAGASRYIECRLSKYAMKCFFEDFAISNVDMKPTYTGDDVEPEVLPARYPHALFNPQLSGIGYAFASNIPPFNLTEVMEATIKLIKNPNAKILLIPDSPTGADVVDDGQFKEINETGIGTFTLRGSIEVDEINNILTITSIPLQTTIDSIIRKIVELKEKKVFDEIKDIKDYTKNKTGVKTMIYLDPSANPYDTIEKLYSKSTGLKKTYPVGMKMIDDYRDYDYGVKSFLLAWIEYRRDTVRSSFNTKLVKAMEEQNMNDIMIFVTNSNNAETTVKISKQSVDVKEAAEKLMKHYDINSQQAMTIAQMRMSELNSTAREKYKTRKKELIDEIKEIESILDDDDKIDNVIIDQLKEGIKLFGTPRRSKIVNDEEVEVEDSEHIVAISTDGYIKKVALKNQQVGQVGNASGQYMAMRVNNKNSLLIFDSHGMISKLKINDVPDMELTDSGIPVERFIPNCGRVVSALIEPSKSDMKKLGKDLFIVFLTKDGFVKKTAIKEFSEINGSTMAIKLPASDELIATEFTADETTKDMIIYTNRGNGIRRDINEFSVMKANARGVRQITMGDDEVCVGFDKINPNKKYMFFITSAGRAKITEVRYLPTMKRKDDAVSLINLDKNETLVGIHSVGRKDKAIIYKKNGQPVTINISDMPISTRIAKAEKMVKTPKGDCVLSYTILGK